MKAIKEAWFEFRGMRSDQMGLEMIARPKFTQGDAGGTNYALTGRRGQIWLGDGGCANGMAELTCVLPAGDMDEISAWLMGSGELRFSVEPDRAWRARVIRGVVCTQPFSHLSGRQLTVKFDLQPWKYMYPQPDDIELTQPGLITNPGNAPAQPLLVIEASGDIAVNIGGCEMEFEGLTEGVIVDCEAMECLAPDESVLLNGCARMERYPEIPAGVSGVTWRGNVQRMTVTPRWRFIG